MKKLNVTIAILGLVFIFTACAPTEEVQPQDGKQKLEKFSVKKDIEDEGNTGRK